MRSSAKVIETPGFRIVFVQRYKPVCCDSVPSLICIACQSRARRNPEHPFKEFAAAVLITTDDGRPYVQNQFATYFPECFTLSVFIMCIG